MGLFSGIKNIFKKTGGAVKEATAAIGSKVNKQAAEEVMQKTTKKATEAVNKTTAKATKARKKVSKKLARARKLRGDKPQEAIKEVAPKPEAKVEQPKEPEAKAQQPKAEPTPEKVEPTPEPVEAKPEPVQEKVESAPEQVESKPEPAPETANTQPEQVETKPEPAPEKVEPQPEPVPEKAPEPEPEAEAPKEVAKTPAELAEEAEKQIKAQRESWNNELKKIQNSIDTIEKPPVERGEGLDIPITDATDLEYNELIKRRDELNSNLKYNTDVSKLSLDDKYLLEKQYETKDLLTPQERKMQDKKVAKGKKEAEEKALKTPSEYQKEFDESLKSGGEFDISKYITSGDDEKADKFFSERIKNQYNNKIAELKSQKEIEDAINNVRQSGIEVSDGASASEIAKAVQDHYQNEAAKGATNMDWMMGHKVPHKALYGGLMGTQLLSFMSDGGKKSNAELYADPFSQM